MGIIVFMENLNYKIYNIWDTIYYDIYHHFYTVCIEESADEKFVALYNLTDVITCNWFEACRLTKRYQHLVTDYENGCYEMNG